MGSKEVFPPVMGNRSLRSFFFALKEVGKYSIVWGRHVWEVLVHICITGGAAVGHCD